MSPVLGTTQAVRQQVGNIQVPEYFFRFHYIRITQFLYPSQPQVEEGPHFRIRARRVLVGNRLIGITLHT